MKILNIIITAALTLCLFVACKNQSGQNTENGQNAIDSTTNGEKKVFYPDGKLQYLAEFKNGKANGRVREYTPDGKLYMDALFADGHRHGKCTHFYKNGNPFEVSNYVNGEKDGEVTKYYDNGNVLATFVCRKNKVQPGLKEFRKDGSEIDNDNTIIINEIDHTALEGKYILKVSLSKPQSNTTFYAAPKSDPEAREKLKVVGNSGILEIPVSSKDFTMKSLIFQVEYKTHQGNTMRIHKTFNIAVDG
jgi:hypothetical protein